MLNSQCPSMSLLKHLYLIDKTFSSMFPLFLHPSFHPSFYITSSPSLFSVTFTAAHPPLVELVSPRPLPDPSAPPGFDQCQGSGVPSQGRPQCPDSTSNHPRVGEVLSPAVRRLLHPALDRCHPLLPGLRHPGCHRG